MKHEYFKLIITIIIAASQSQSFTKICILGSVAERFSISQILLLVGFFFYFIFYQNRKHSNIITEYWGWQDVLLPDALDIWMKYEPRDFE